MRKKQSKKTQTVFILVRPNDSSYFQCLLFIDLDNNVRYKLRISQTLLIRKLIVQTKQYAFEDFLASNFRT